MRTPDLAGKRFGRLVVIAKETDRISKHDVHWLCQCDCGKKACVTTGHLTAGTVTSCGCLRKEQAIERFKKAAEDNVKHGEARSHLYTVWHVMKQRCENKKNPGFKYYGGKGVKVCDAWQEYKGFAEWAYQNGYEYRETAEWKDKLSIDRIDSNGDYCPENCRWITVSENTIRATKARWENAKRAKGSGRTKSAVSMDSAV